jgi:uncharacterized protein VirK/YbjX
MAGDMALVNTMIGITSILAGITSELIGVRPAIIVFATAAAFASVVYIFATAGIRKRLHTAQQLQ